jgi:cold shock protein
MGIMSNHIRATKRKRSMFFSNFACDKGIGMPKGRCSIVQDTDGPDVFVHVTPVERAGMGGLVKDQKVAFDIVADAASGNCSAATNCANGDWFKGFEDRT